MSIKSGEGQEDWITFQSHISEWYRPARILGQKGKNSITLTPLSLGQPIVPLVQLAPSHRTEKKSNWMLVRNDWIQLWCLHKQTKTFGGVHSGQTTSVNCTSRNCSAMGKSPKLRLVPLQILWTVWGHIGRALSIYFRLPALARGTAGKPIKLSFLFWCQLMKQSSLADLSHCIAPPPAVPESCWMSVSKLTPNC